MSLQKQRGITITIPDGIILCKKAKQEDLQKQKLSQQYHLYVKVLLHLAVRPMWYEGQSSLVLLELIELGIKLQYYILGKSKQEHQL